MYQTRSVTRSTSAHKQQPANQQQIVERRAAQHSSTVVTALTHKNIPVRVNSFVEVLGEDDEKWIMLITKLYRLPRGEWRVSGPWLYRREDNMEEEIEHEKELVMSNHVNSSPVSVIGEEVSVVSWKTFRKNKATLLDRVYFVRKFYDRTTGIVKKMDFEQYVCRLAGVLGQPSAFAHLPCLQPKVLYASMLLQKLQRRMAQTERSPFLTFRLVMKLSDFEEVFKETPLTYRPHPNRALYASLHSVTELSYLLGPCDETARTGWCFHVDRV